MIADAESGFEDPCRPAAEITFERARGGAHPRRGGGAPEPGVPHRRAAVVLYYALSITRQFAALQRALADGKLASDTGPLEEFLGYKGAGGRDP